MIHQFTNKERHSMSHRLNQITHRIKINMSRKETMEDHTKIKQYSKIITSFSQIIIDNPSNLLKISRQVSNRTKVLRKIITRIQGQEIRAANLH
jgi:hypothetical protein